jgi:ABC-type multidrug transport system ATPase subunit
MRCELSNITKTFQYNKVFHNVNLVLDAGYRGVVLGGNGSGKSTLLKIIAGSLTPSEGSVRFFFDGQQLPGFDAIKHLSFAAPYIDLIEDFTIPELLHFTQKFKPFKDQLRPQDILELSGLQMAQKKPIKYFSSGMKQRVKLATAILSDTSLLILDEPHSNLDAKGMDWYHNLLAAHLDNRIVIVGSNHQPEEYFFASHQIKIEDYKK